MSGLLLALVLALPLTALLPQLQLLPQLLLPQLLPLALLLADSLRVGELQLALLSVRLALMAHPLSRLVFPVLLAVPLAVSLAVLLRSA